MRNSVQQARSTRERVRRMLFFPWKMQQFVSRRLDALMTVSQTSAKAINEAFDLPPGLLEVFHIGVDTDVFRPLPEVERAPRHILYVVNSEDRNKGARYFFEALAMLRDEEAFHVSIVDRPRHELKLAPDLIREYGLSARVNFLGRVSTEELVRLYNRAEFAVCASLYEGFGLPAAEAAACGTPLLSTNGGALSEVLEDGRSALLVPPGDSAALAAGMRRMLHEPELRARLSSTSRAEIVRRFDWAQTALETERIYERVVARRRGTLTLQTPASATQAGRPLPPGQELLVRNDGSGLRSKSNPEGRADRRQESHHRYHRPFERSKRQTPSLRQVGRAAIARARHT
jgi:glycosyltransferase involved in cell wall biosynthesis